MHDVCRAVGSTGTSGTNEDRLEVKDGSKRPVFRCSRGGHADENDKKCIFDVVHVHSMLLEYYHTAVA